MPKNIKKAGVMTPAFFTIRVVYYAKGFCPVSNEAG